MKIKAEQKNSRQSPRKVRVVANEVKDLSLDKAFEQLALMERKGALVVLKTLRQAVANAIHNHHLQFEDLEIDQILVKQGPTYKRWRAVARGRAHEIQKKTCHVEVLLTTKKRSDSPKSKKSNKKQAKKGKTDNKQTAKKTKKKTGKKTAKKTKKKAKVNKNSQRNKANKKD